MLTDSVESELFKCLLERWNKFLAICMILHHFAETCWFVRCSANPEHHFELIIACFQQIALCKGFDEIIVDDERAVLYRNDSNVYMTAQMRVEVAEQWRVTLTLSNDSFLHCIVISTTWRCVVANETFCVLPWALFRLDRVNVSAEFWWNNNRRLIVDIWRRGFNWSQILVVWKLMFSIESQSCMPKIWNVW